MSSSASAVSRPVFLRSQSRCVVCGQEHPHGLRIRFGAGPSGSAEAEWTPTSDWEGFEGIIHGGLISTVLDEAMSKAVAATGSRALTGELRVRFRTHVETGSPYRIRGWINERRKRLLRTEATLMTTSGEECAHAWATFVEVPRSHDSVAQAENPSRGSV